MEMVANTKIKKAVLYLNILTRLDKNRQSSSVV